MAATAGKTRQVETNTDTFYREKVPYFLPAIPGQDSSVTVTINGINYQVQRGKQVQVPRSVALVLEESQRNEMEAYEKRQQLQDEYFSREDKF